MIFWALVVLGASVKLAKEHKKGKRKLRERLIHSKKSMNLPRSFVGIPRAFSNRALAELKRTDGGSRELYFDENFDGIFTMTTKTQSLRTLDSRSADDVSVASKASEEEEFWC